MSVPLLGMVDTAVVGHLPEPHHLGGVALGATAFAAIYLVFASVRMGTTGLTAQAVGAGDGAEARACLVRPLMIALLIGTALVLAGPAVRALLIQGFAPPPAVAAALDQYVAWRLLGAPAALANFVILGWLLGNHDSRSQLAILLTTNLINACLTLLFVLAFDWGVPGVGGATAIADYAGFALGLWFARDRWRWLPDRLDPATLLTAEAFRRLFRVNGDLLLRTLCIEATLLGFAALSGRQGEVLLAANAVLNNFVMLQAYALDGFAFATEALAGRAVGRGTQRDLDRTLRAAGEWSIGFALVLVIVFGLAGPILIAILTSIPDVRAAAGLFLPYAALVPAFGVWAYLYDGVFAGATQTRELRDGSALATLAFFTLALTLIPALGNHGLWLALMGFLLARSIWFHHRYRRLRARARFLVPDAG